MDRSELLDWVNTTCQTDYPKIDNLSDGIGYCQIIDAFFGNVNQEVMKLKLNSKEKDDWAKNFILLNEMLAKQKSYKQVDPMKLSKGNFSANLEFLQFLYDFILKSFNTGKPNKYKGLQRRIEILKSQYGNKINSNTYKKYLPNHLLTNEILLELQREKFLANKYKNRNDDNNNNNDINNYGEDDMNNNAFSDGEENNNNNNDENKKEENKELNDTLKNYQKYFQILKEDLEIKMEKNRRIEQSIFEVTDENNFYITKINTILGFCEGKLSKIKNKKNAEILNKIIEIITDVPEEFK